MKNKILLKILALGLAVSVGAVFLLAGMRTEASADSAAPDTVSSATRGAGGTGGAANTTGSDGSPLVNAAELFSERDWEQSPDLSGAVTLTVRDGETYRITEEGIYVLQGSAADAAVIVEAADTAKVQLVLDGVSIENAGFPCIYVKSADKVFITALADSSLSVTGSFVSDGDTNIDAVIFSRSDLVLNGTASLYISSSENGVSCKDDLKVTGGSYWISAGSKCLEANDSIRIAGGSFSPFPSRNSLSSHGLSVIIPSTPISYMVSKSSIKPTVHGTTLIPSSCASSVSAFVISLKYGLTSSIPSECAARTGSPSKSRISIPPSHGEGSSRSSHSVVPSGAPQEGCSL